MVSQPIPSTFEPPAAPAAARLGTLRTTTPSGPGDVAGAERLDSHAVTRLTTTSAASKAAGISRRELRWGDTILLSSSFTVDRRPDVVIVGSIHT